MTIRHGLPYVRILSENQTASGQYTTEKYGQGKGTAEVNEIGKGTAE